MNGQQKAKKDQKIKKKKVRKMARKLFRINLLKSGSVMRETNILETWLLTTKVYGIQHKIAKI